MREWRLGLAVILLLAGCRSLGGKNEGVVELERDFRNSERQVKETRTLSSLVQLESALASYVKAERRIPDKLKQLIPKYLAEIPTIDVDVRSHRETNSVKVYPGSILRDGLIDGTRLQDTGEWGYVHNDRQVVIFVDCTHPSSRGRPWYQERGTP